MLTFQQIGDEAASQCEDDTAPTRTLIDRAINQGTQKFAAVLNREWRRAERTFSISASSQFYQTPEDCVRIKSICITVGGIQYWPEEIDEAEWNRLNERTTTSDVPEFYFPKGADLFGIWPTPATTISNAGTIAYESRTKRMSAADYTTGTITVAHNSQAIVGASTTFTGQMVGRALLVEDGGDQDGIAYKIGSFTDATHITLENYYAGLAGSGKSYRIGEVPDIPDEFHESLVDYALYRVYKKRRDRGMSNDCKAAFDEAVILCQQNYSSNTASQYMRVRRPTQRAGFVYQPRDYTVNNA